MSGLSAILDVIVGLAFVYLLLSLICSATVEYVEMWLRRRGILLKQGISELLNESRGDAPNLVLASLGAAIWGWLGRIWRVLTGAGKGQSPALEPTFVEKIYRNPLVYALYRGQLDLGGRFLGGNLPSYIPPNTFVLALIDELVKADNIEARLQIIDGLDGLTPAQKSALRAAIKAKVEAQVGMPLTQAFESAAQTPLDIPEDCRRLLQTRLVDVSDLAVPSTAAELVGLIERSNALDHSVKGSMKLLLGTVKDDFGTALKTLEAWYGNSTERISGWYRKHTQSLSFLVATVIVVTLNVDTVVMTQALLVNGQLRGAVVEASKGTLLNPRKADGQTSAEATEALNADAVKSLKNTLFSMGLPIGWHNEQEVPLAGSSASGAGPSAGDETSQKATSTSSAPAHPVTAPVSSEPPDIFDQTSRLIRHIRISWPEHIGGWTISIIAISFGAPFWFDMLNKLMRFRTAVKPQSDEERGKAEESK